MQTKILTNGGKDRLILFFNGWSASPSVVNHLKAEAGTTVAVVYDYTSFPELTFDLSPYREIHLVAWSMGVFAAEQVLRGLPLASATAINGTPHPVDDECGIPTTVFRGTLANLSDDTLARFTRRMCGSTTVLNAYCQHEVGRPLDSLRTELENMARWYEATLPPVVPFPWTQAILSRNDRIFPFINQERYWSAMPCIRLYTDAPHYPFYLWNEWKQVLPR